MFNILEEIGIGSANDGERMEILNASGESFTDNENEQPYLVVLGKDSNAFRARQQDLAIELINKRKDDEDYQDTPNETSERTNKLLVSCISGWGNIGEDNMPLDFNEENALHLLENSPSLSDQVNLFVGKRENFLKK